MKKIFWYIIIILFLVGLTMAQDYRWNSGVYQGDEPGTRYRVNIGASQADNPATTPSQPIIIMVETE